MRNANRVMTAIAVIGIGLAVASGQLPIRSQSADESIRKAVDAYVAAYNKGDLDTVMSNWAEGAEFISEGGVSVRGKEAVGSLFRRGLADHKGQTMKIKIESLRIPRPDLALLDGSAEMATPGEKSNVGPFTSVWTKSADKWQIVSVRDLPTPDNGDHNDSPTQLQSLDWLVGDWLFQDKDTVVTISCKRTQKQSFMRIDQVVKVKGAEVLSLTQVIGWDPRFQQIRSWVFDSAGGFGEGLWERRGNEWYVEAEGVRTDGQVASATNIWKFVDANSFEWRSTNRDIDGEPVPDLQARYARQSAK